MQNKTFLLFFLLFFSLVPLSVIATRPALTDFYLDFDYFNEESALKNALIAIENIEVTGLVTDSTGNPINGVTVVVKGQPDIGTSTDVNGRYTLVVPDNTILLFSAVGYTSMEVPVNGRNRIDVSMGSEVTALDDIVVTAFGQKRRRSDVVGSVTTVNPSDLKIPASNLTAALSGRAAGIIAYQRTGEPGMDNANFFIRGVTTFGYKVDPLILIDNMESSPTELARLQVDDIENFSILKDATATAVYGARGANGVLLITTKEGRIEKLNTSLRIENSLSMPTRDVDFVDPITYMKMANEAVLGRNPLGVMPYSLQKIEKTDINNSTPEYPAVDWRNELLKKNAMNQRVNLSVRGGGSVAQFYVSGAFNQDNGIIKVPNRSNFNNNINLKTYSLRANVDMTLTKSTVLKVKLSGLFDDYNGPLHGGATVYQDILRTPPTLFQPFYPPGETYKYLHHIMFGNAGDGNYLNPYADMVKGYKQYSQSTMQAQFEVNQNLKAITPGLSFSLRGTASRYGYFAVTREYNPFYYEYMGKGANNEAIYNLMNENSGTEYLGYDAGSKDLSSIFFMQGILDYQRSISENSRITGLLVGMLRSELTGSAGSLQQSLPHRNMNLAGRVTYGYKNRYDIEFNFGYNGSERFSSSHRFGFFPSVGAAWHVSKEDFWKNIRQTVSNFRIRATYGLVGNDAVGTPSQRFFYLSEVNANGPGFTFGRELDETLAGFRIIRYANEGITWETSTKSDLAVEIGLFNQLDIEANWFREKRTNIFMARANIPATMGLASSTYANIGEAYGEGIDIGLTYSKTMSPRAWMKGMANFTYATSKYEKYEEPDYLEPWLYHPGYPISIGRGYIAERLFIDDNEAANSPDQNFGGLVRGGDIKYIDVNGDGIISTLDRVPIGYPTIPEINYGFGVSFGFTNFDFSIFFQGLARESFFIDPVATAPFRSYRYPSEVSSGRLSGNSIQNQVLQVYADDYWSEENRNLYALYPRLSWLGGSPNNEQTSTWWMRDGSFLRLKQLEVGYSFSNKGILQRIGTKNFRVYLTGLNLLSFSKFKLWDVEMASNGLSYPIQKVYNLGIKLDF